MTVNAQEGARPSRRPAPADLADWQARTFPGLGRYAASPPAELGLDDELADDLIGDPDAARAHIAALRRTGRL